ncbi:MAG: redoxin domain-containing protein, partial [Pirellulales bacterium]
MTFRKNRGRLGLALAIGAALAGAATAAPSDQETKDPVAIGQKVPNVRSLRDLKGNRRPLRDFRGTRAVVLAFLGTECPLARLYIPRLAELEKHYRGKNVVMIGVYPNAHETLDEIAGHAYDRDLAFPILKDFNQSLADTLGVQRTPEVVVLDSEFRVRYRGRIDDQYAVNSRRVKPTRHDLREALDEVLAGKRVTVPETAADGCLLDRARTRPKIPGLTYAGDIAAIIQNRCQGCHRPGRVGPFELMTYDDVVQWSAMIKEVVSQRRMPPWHADPRWGEFGNERRMTPEEIDKVVSWIDSGTPLGDPAEMPEAPEWPEGWSIGKPDGVFQMPEEYRVPADGLLPYRYYRVEAPFSQDVWVQAAEVRPSAPQVVHHVIVYMRRPGDRRPVAIDGTISALCGYA